MDREKLLQSEYDKDRFLASFYHVVWLRRVFVIDENQSLVSMFKAIVASPPPPCQANCRTCVTRPLYDTAYGSAPDCRARVMTWAEYLFFKSKWTGDMPQCIYRCHLITCSSSAYLKVQHAVLYDYCAQRAFKVDTSQFDKNDLDKVQILENGRPPTNEQGHRTFNSTALTVSTYMLCQLLRPDNPVELYMSVRAALLVPGTTCEPVQSIRDVIVSIVFDRKYVTPSTGNPVWLDLYKAWLRKYSEIVCVNERFKNITLLNVSPSLRCDMADDVVVSESVLSPGGDEYIVLALPGKTMVDCRYTLHLWVRLLQLVSPQSCSCFMSNGTPVIKMRKDDLARVMRYAAVHLHCMDIIQLRTPVYKIMCQNYAQLHIDGDCAAANLFIKDVLSLLISKNDHVKMPQHSPYYNYAGLGVLHGILPRFQGAHFLLSMRPFIDEASLHFKDVSQWKPEPGAFLKRPISNYRLTNGVKMDILGIKWDARSIHSSLIAFLLQKLPHVISEDAVKALHAALRSSGQTSSCHRVIVVIDHLYGLFHDENKVVSIDGKRYVKIPPQIPNVVPQECSVVGYVYSLLSSPIISHDLAQECFLEIRLDPRVTVHGALRQSVTHSFAPADTRKGGVAALRNMQRVYNKTGPPHVMHPLYNKPTCLFLEYMESVLFVLEMQSYLQAKRVDSGTLGAKRQTFGMKPAPKPTPLAEHTYRGEMSPMHVVRYRRDDARDVTKNQAAYEIGENMYQTTSLPVVVYANTMPWENPKNAFYGADPLLIECLFLAPLDHVEIETPKMYCKRKRHVNLVEDFVEQPEFKPVPSPLLEVPPCGFDMDYREFRP